MKRGNVVFNDFFFRGFNPQQWWKTCLNQSFDPISQNAVFFFISVQHQRGSHLVSFFYSSTKICNVQIVGWGSTSISQGAPANLSYFPTRPHWGVGPLWAPPAPKYFPNPAHLQVLPKSRFGRKCIMVKLAVCAFSKKVTTHWEGRGCKSKAPDGHEVN